MSTGAQVLKQAGGAAQPTVFLFSDSQLKEESFLEDVNNILNTGEVRRLREAGASAGGRVPGLRAPHLIPHRIRQLPGCETCECVHSVVLIESERYD